MWVRVVHHKPKGEEVQFETVDTLNDLNSMFYNRVISNWKIDSKKRLQDALRNWILFRLKPDQLCPSHFQLKLDTQVKLSYTETMLPRNVKTESKVLQQNQAYSFLLHS